jgi:hypothetical protein
MLASLGLAAIGGSAQAAKSLWGWFLVASPSTTPDGVTFTAGGLPVWNAAYAFDNSGNLKCLLRPKANNEILTRSDCPAAATKFQASIRTSAQSFCSSSMGAWNSAVVGCQTPAMAFVPSSGGSGNYSLAGFARGYGN